MKLFSKVLLGFCLLGTLGTGLAQTTAKAEEINPEVTPRIQKAEVVDRFKKRRDLSTGLMSGQYDQTYKIISDHSSFTVNDRYLSEYVSSDGKYRIFQYEKVYYLN